MSRRSFPAIAVFVLALVLGMSFARPSSRAHAAGPYAPVCPGTAPGVYCLQVDMYGTNVVPPVDTQAWGFYRFFFNAARTEADVTLDVKGLSQTLVTGADIRLGSAASMGPLLYHLSDGGFIVTGVHMKFSQADLQQMLSGQWWVQVSSQFHPDGEMRGHLVLPSDFFPNAAPPPAPIAQPQPVIQLPPEQISVQSVAPAPPPPLETLPPGVVPDDSNAAVALGAATAFQLFEECRPGGSVRIRMSWVASGMGPQFADLSLFNDNFAENDYVGQGPMAPNVRNLTWDGLIGATWHYLRVNTQLVDGTWAPSQTIAFYTRNDCH